MINFQRPAFQDLNNFCNKRFCIRSYCLSSELYIIATALETQEQADNYCTHKFYPHWSVSHSSLAIFQSPVDMLYFTFRFCIIVFVMTRTALNRGFVPYILLYLWQSWRKSFVIPRTSLYRGSASVHTKRDKISIISYRMISNASTELEQLVHTHRISYQSCWPRGLGELNPSLISRIFFPSQWTPVLGPTYSLPWSSRDSPNTSVFTLHQSMTLNLSHMWRSTFKISAPFQ